jgi:hypothetical protein
MYLSEEANWHNHLKFLFATANIAQFTCKEMEFSYLEDTAFLGGLLRPARSLPPFFYLEDTAFLGGLLHDIGKLLFLRLQTAGYIHVYLYAQQNNILIGDSERLHMGLSTRQMAIEFIEKKCFPTAFKNVIRWIEEPDQATEEFELVSVVAIARYMCRLCKVGFSGEINQKDLLPLEHTQLWASIQHRVFPSFNVSNFEALVRNRLRQVYFFRSPHDPRLNLFHGFTEGGIASLRSPSLVDSKAGEEKVPAG